MRRYTVRIRDVDYVLDVDDVGQDSYMVTADGQSIPVKILSDEARDRNHDDGATQTAQVGTETALNQSETGESIIVAPMPGLIMSVAVEVGSKVKYGDVLVSLEAMKMENSIRSPIDGVVTAVSATAGENVEHDAVLMKIRG